MFNLATIGNGLPVAGVIDQLPPSGPLVVEAPPGTGKTTLIPPAISNVAGKTIVTAPRRVAVRAAARRLAQLDETNIGERVGYSIRGEHHPGTLVEFVTPGVLLNRLLKDPDLDGVGAVVLDEVHERQLDTDLALAMCMEIAVLRDDFYLAAMSATLDAQKLAAHMGATILSTEAVTHPLTITYEPHSGRVEDSRDFYRHVATLARNTKRTLVFVPGVREVELVGSHLSDWAPLHGRLSSEEQDRALHGDNQVVVATSIAESSITVPGVRRVVDAGLSRVPRRQRGMTSLVTVSAAKTSADQRAGRAGRLGPGEVVRAYSQPDYQHFQPYIVPEIATSDLTAAALMIAAWGSPDLPLLDQPPASSLDDARATLRDLGALDETGITPLGQRLATFPLEPRLGAALLTCGSGAAGTVAALSEGMSGDLSRVRPPQRETARLARMVDDKGPVSAGTAISCAYPQWIARNVGDTYLLASGTRAIVDRGISTTEWIAAADVQLTAKGAIIRAAAPLEMPTERIREYTTASLIDGRVRARRVKAVGAIELSSTPISVSPSEAMTALGDIQFSNFVLDERAQKLKDRLDFLHNQVGEPWPDVADGDYSPEIAELANGASISDLDMRKAFMRQLPNGRLNELAPERLEVGPVDYSTGRPIVRVKLQRCFGLSKSPTIAGMKVLFHLLSPAGRELAVTDDLTSFWNGPYQQVRKEMRGRYPKHAWPEDPWNP